MASNATPKIDAICIGYNGPQDKTVPALLLNANPINDLEALFHALGLSQADDEFDMYTVTVDKATFQNLAEITASTTSDVAAETAILSVTMIDTHIPSSQTVTLSKQSAGAYVGRVRSAVEGTNGFDAINAWTARTNLVHR